MPNDAIEERAERSVRTNGASPRDDVVDEETPRRTGEVRVVAVEAAVAAGLVEAPPDAELTAPADDDTASIPLPDWTDPPTGQVPRVLLDEGEDPEAPRVKGPSWRQRPQDWDEDADTFEYLVEDVEDEIDERAAIAGRESAGVAEGDPFEFDFEPPTLHPRLGESNAPVDYGAREGVIVNGAPDDAAWS
ncbi:MAG: hypothetical protein WCF24_04270, partial [Acidimicrobiales bacterium]